MKQKKYLEEKLILTNQNIDKVYKNMNKIIGKYQKRYLINLEYTEEIEDKKKKKEIEEVIKAINLKDRRKRYTYIYDTICSKLDNNGPNCNFKDNVCEKYRDRCHYNGCCESTKNGKCNYLGDDGCKIKCISCKFFICDYFKKQDRALVKNPNSFLLSKYFFNLEQKMILTFTFFTKEEEIIDKLLQAKFKKG